MSKKSGNFFEAHIEKMVFAIVGVVCLWVLVSRVVISPNQISYDNRKFGPGRIDAYINNETELLREKLSAKAKPKSAYDDERVRQFNAIFDSVIGGIDDTVVLSLPGHLTREIIIDREFDLPLIGPVEDVTAGYLGAVAYVPTEQVSEKNSYEKVAHEPNDLDLVTVEAKFDVPSLYDRFKESFDGEDVKPEWRDPCLARPIFAAAQLQRQELLADGRWSGWEIVPRAKIDSRSELFKTVEDVAELPRGGMKVRLLQYDDRETMADLLQPASYRIASPDDDWLPPSFHKEFVRIGEKEKAQERHDARAKEAKKEKRERGRAGAGRSSRRSRNSAAGSMPAGMGGAMPAGMGGGGGGTTKRPKRTKRDRTRRVREEKKPEKAEEKTAQTTKFVLATNVLQKK